MKSLALALMIGMLLAPSVSAYTLITDPDLFYSRYGSPKIVIEFTELKDGTVIENISAVHKPHTLLVSDSDHHCLVPVDQKDGNDSPPSLAVSSQAFSDDWSFRGADPKTPGLFCEVITWFEHGITSGQYHMAVSAAAGRSQPFAVYTGSGFIGVIPSSPRETSFIFDTFNTVFSFETGYSQANPRPKPSSTPHISRDDYAALIRP